MARAAFYPSLTLSASGGFDARDARAAARHAERASGRSARRWRRRCSTAACAGRAATQAVAAYDIAVAQYKQTVLNGFQQVEDDLATLRVLDRETALQDEAVQRRRSSPSGWRWPSTAAAPPPISRVVTAQTLSLSNQRTAVQLRSRQLPTSVALIAATGGGWIAGGDRLGRRRAAGRRSTPRNRPRTSSGR